MIRYEYCCVNAPVGIIVNKPADRESAIKSYENIINLQAADGWEYVGMDSYSTQLKPGCLNLAPQQMWETHRMLVFRRQVEG